MRVRSAAASASTLTGSSFSARPEIDAVAMGDGRELDDRRARELDQVDGLELGGCRRRRRAPGEPA
ncbi:MAG: hypothetical protein R3E48_20760 [Burkholderiaceae bacterium]